MTLKHMVLASAAALALTTGGALAQNYTDDTPPSYYRSNPTPQERAQTEALNEQQAAEDGVAADGETGNTADARYRSELQQYRDERRAYRERQSDYRDRLAEYEYDRTHPEDWWRAHYYSASVGPFYDKDGGELVGREVNERDGLRVGRIVAVEREPDGDLERVQVALDNGRIAWIDADDLRFDMPDDIVFTDVPADTIYDNSRVAVYDVRP